ncbi:MAG: hypothetical protein HRT74_02700 [Flavobacteriales bacterium]|nr:hypothetical protein [Flavobacteriales bacterium]
MNVRIIAFLSLFFFCCWACQAPPSDGSAEFRYQTTHADEHSQFSRDFVQENKDWNWQFVGPDQQPTELNPGSTALPTYAVGRGNGTGRINRLVLDENHPKRLFACSPTGGLFITENHGKTWSSAGTDNLPISGVAAVTLHPDKKNTWFLCTGDSDDNFMYSDGVWKTEDGGKSYVCINGINGIEPSCHFKRQVFSSDILYPRGLDNTLIHVGSFGAKITKNANVNPAEVRWKQIRQTHYYDIAQHPTLDSVIVLSGQNMIITLDGGNSWERVKYPIQPDEFKFPFVRMSVEWSGTNDDILWVTYTRSTQLNQGSAGEAFLYRYNWKNKEWTKVRSLKKGMNNVIATRARAFAVSPITDSLVLCGNVKPVYRSTDGGASFKRIESNQMHDDIHHLIFEPNGQTVWASHDGGVSVSYDAGLTFENADNGIGAANIFGVSVGQNEEEEILWGGYDVGGNQYDDGRWTHVNFGDGFETGFDASTEHRFVTRQNGYIHHSDNGGESFERRASGGNSKSEWHTWFKVDQSSPGILYNAGKNVVRTNYLNGKHEVIFDTKAYNQELLTTYKLWNSKHHKGLLYLYILDPSLINPVIMRSYNALDNSDAVKWDELPKSPKSGWIMDIVPHPRNKNQFWVVYNDTEPVNRVLFFDGNNYLDETYNLGYLVAESMIIDPVTFRLYLGTSHGVYTKKPGEQKWVLLNGLPGTMIKTMDIHEKRRQLYVGTYGRGVWKAPLMKD